MVGYPTFPSYIHVLIRTGRTQKIKIKVMLVDFSSLVEKNVIFRDNVINTNTSELSKMLGVSISDAQTLQVQAMLNNK